MTKLCYLPLNILTRLLGSSIVVLTLSMWSRSLPSHLDGPHITVPGLDPHGKHSKTAISLPKQFVGHPSSSSILSDRNFTIGVAMTVTGCSKFPLDSAAVLQYSI